MDKPRFVVRSVTGRTINPAADGSGKTHQPLPTAYYVLDRWNCWRVVAAYEVPVRGGNVPGEDATRRRRAEARAAELTGLAERLAHA